MTGSFAASVSASPLNAAASSASSVCLASSWAQYSAR